MEFSASRFLIASIAAIAAIASPCSTLAQAGASASPVTINSCAPDLSTSSSAPNVAGIPLSSTSTGMKIEFVNDASKVATLVNFDVVSNGTQFVIRDVGTFSPGVSIVHRFRNGAGQAFVLPSFIAPNVTCQVASVRFADGTFWSKGQPAQSSTSVSSGKPSALSASPSQVELDRTAESNLFLVSSGERVAAFKETDNCDGVASIFVAATGESTATYSVKPIGPGSCTAHIRDEAGNELSVPIVIR